MGGVEARGSLAGTTQGRRSRPPRARTDFKYGRDRGRSLAAIQRGQAASAVFRRALLLVRRGARRAGAGPRALQSRTDEVPEERRRARRARLELGVELAGHEPGVVVQLDDLHEPPLLVRARDDQSGLHEPRPEVVVHLVAVPVAFVDDGLAVG